MYGTKMNTLPLRMSYASFGRFFFPGRFWRSNFDVEGSNTSTTSPSAVLELALATAASVVIELLPGIVGRKLVVDNG